MLVELANCPQLPGLTMRAVAVAVPAPHLLMLAELVAVLPVVVAMLWLHLLQAIQAAVVVAAELTEACLKAAAQAAPEL